MWTLNIYNGPSWHNCIKLYGKCLIWVQTACKGYQQTTFFCNNASAIDVNFKCTWEFLPWKKYQRTYLPERYFCWKADNNNKHVVCKIDTDWKSIIDRLRAKKGPAPPLGNFADISYLEENFKPHLLRDVCTLCSGALVSDSLLHMLL